MPMRIGFFFIALTSSIKPYFFELKKKNLTMSGNYTMYNIYIYLHKTENEISAIKHEKIILCTNRGT